MESIRKEGKKKKKKKRLEEKKAYEKGRQKKNPINYKRLIL